jgi:hypothetical protein
MTTQETTQTGTVCYRHPQTETSLRCTKCDRYICPRCAVRTPVGYICPECQRSHENKFFTGKLGDYGIAVIIALPLCIIAAFLFGAVLSRFGFLSWIIAFFGAPFAGGLIAEAVRWGVQRRRSRYLGRIVAGCLILSLLPFILLYLFNGPLFGLIVPGILLFMGTGTILARLR